MPYTNTPHNKKEVSSNCNGVKRKYNTSNSNTKLYSDKFESTISLINVFSFNIGCFDCTWIGFVDAVQCNALYYKLNAVLIYTF